MTILKSRLKKHQSIDISYIVDISTWNHAEENLGGSRVKKIVSAPEDEQQYVFKEPKERQKAQIWSEVISSFIAGDLLGWDVQHTQIATDNDRIGNLLKYIYNPNIDQFVEGERFCKHIDPSFDPKEGTRHIWQLIEDIHHRYDAVTSDFVSKDDYFKFWGQCFAFDALISNTDRHAENWAILVTNDNVRMAPLYDNATSMGCEVEELGLAKWFDRDGALITSKIESYLTKGRHHIRDEHNRIKLNEICMFAIEKHPIMHSEFVKIANLDLEPVKELLLKICDFDGIPDDARMTKMRSDQILSLLHLGQNRVTRTLEQYNDQ